MKIDRNDEVRQELVRMSREMAQQEDLNYRIAGCIEKRMTAVLNNPEYLNAVSELAGYFQVRKKKILPLIALGRRIGLEGERLIPFLEQYLPYTTVYSAKELMQNPYFAGIGGAATEEGDFRFEEDRFLNGEIFFDREPAAEGYRRINTIGVMDGELRYPSFYEGDRCWMSITPNETVTMGEPVKRASGKVLTLGLGLGYYAYMAHLKSEVTSVTVVEREPAVIRLFEERLLPRFDHPEKIRILQEDAVSYLEGIADGEYDYCFADIWQNPLDGMTAYLRVRAAGNRFHKMRCDYWIEESFIGCLEQSAANVLQFAYLDEPDTQLMGRPEYAVMKELLDDADIREAKDIREMFGGEYVRRLLSEKLCSDMLKDL